MKQLYFEDATRAQLLQIALYEDCQLEYKYAAARELDIRRWRDYMLTDLVLLWGKGYTMFDIAIELGISKTTVKNKLYELGLLGKRAKKSVKKGE